MSIITCMHQCTPTYTFFHRLLRLFVSLWPMYEFGGICPHVFSTPPLPLFIILFSGNNWGYFMHLYLPHASTWVSIKKTKHVVDFWPIGICKCNWIICLLYVLLDGIIIFYIRWNISFSTLIFFKKKNYIIHVLIILVTYSITDD